MRICSCSSCKTWPATRSNSIAEGRPESRAPSHFELKAEPGRAVLRIANTGPPLTAEEQERIFERFYRGDPSHNRRVDGVGLGLSLAREIALAHGGELKVDTGTLRLGAVHARAARSYWRATERGGPKLGFSPALAENL